jgi:hypothetical protein
MNALLNTIAPYVAPHMLVLVLAALAGLLLHYVSKHNRGEIDDTLSEYLCDHPGYTLSTLLTILASCFGVVATGQLDTMALHIVVAFGFGIGWTCDSAITPKALGGRASEGGP